MMEHFTTKEQKQIPNKQSKVDGSHRHSVGQKIRQQHYSRGPGEHWLPPALPTGLGCLCAPLLPQPWKVSLVP